MTAADPCAVDGFPPAREGRPLWLVTLADLALLLVGFFVLLQANQSLDRKALAEGIRAGFGAPSAPKDDGAEIDDALPIAAAGVFDFRRGSAVPAQSVASLRAWAQEAARDPRVSLRITAAVDGTPGDVDPATGSAAVLAADRARAVAVALAPVVPGSRLIIQTSERPARRHVVVTLAFTGEPQ